MKYIGSHIGDIDDGYIGSGKYFINSYKKNPNIFLREILEIIEGEDIKNRIKDLEEYYLSKYEVSNNPLYYNISSKYFGGDVYSGLDEKDKKEMIRKTVSRGKEDRLKNPEKYKESYNKMSSSKRRKSRGINQFDMDGNFLNSYLCIEEAWEKTNISKGNIHSAINGSRNSAGGYRWSNKNLPNPIINKTLGRPNGKKNKSPIKRKHVNIVKLTILQYDLIGNLIKKWNSSKEAADSLGISSGCINHFVNGRIPKSGNYGGFIWKKGNLIKVTEYKND
jgi:hypothetical protein